MSFLFAPIISAIAFFVVYFVCPPLIRYLKNHGMTVNDVFKRDKNQVPRPGGIVIIVAIVAAELTLFFATMNYAILAILSTTIIAFFIGFVDDKRVMPGFFKPGMLVAAALPIILLGTYDFYLDFPLFGSAKIPLLYIALIFIAISIAGNTVNSIDVLNGTASGFVAIASVPLIVTLFLQNKIDIAVAALPLLLTALAFYSYHKYPSRIFPGDSGTVAWGAMYGAIAIVGGIEVVATVALLPAIMNSFLYFVNVKRVATEHRKVKRAAMLSDNHDLIVASKENDVPPTLVRLILANGPMHERDIAKSIFKLAGFSAGLTILTAILVGISL